MEKKKVLVVGGSGYLGQHLLQSLADTPWDLAFTHNRPIPPPDLIHAISPVRAFCVDLRTGAGFDSIFDAFGRVSLGESSTSQVLFAFVPADPPSSMGSLTVSSDDLNIYLLEPHIVVNCAALSVPRVCEMDREAAMAINVPSSLINWLSSFSDGSTLLIHLSTDQVYEGTKSFYKEEDETFPVNTYGKSKLAAENYIFANYSNFAILRSSIIYGPQTISPVAKSLPIQWIDGALSGGQEVEFFFDEFRCPVYVKDVVDTILALAKKGITDEKKMQVLLNVGGPNRLSRLQMAETVAAVGKHNSSLARSVSAASAVNRGVNSPADISMNITKLMESLGITPVPFEDGVRLTLGK